jgi:hypothetical protein
MILSDGSRAISNAITASRANANPIAIRFGCPAVAAT